MFNFKREDDTKYHKLKKLEGIKYTNELHSLCQKILDLPQIPTAPKQVMMDDRNIETNTNVTNMNNMKNVYEYATVSIDIETAKSTLETQIQNKETQNDNNNDNHHPCFPIVAIQSMRSLIMNSDIHETEKKEMLDMLENTICKICQTSSLLYTPPVKVSRNAESEQFQKRLQRLRMKVEERKYIHLTSNIALRKQNDVTTRSMTYAASVGLNMIVAPISFGAFMYFFSGHLMGWTLGIDNDVGDTHNHNGKNSGVDVRKVIVGVISGVIMMFIEMILFVIRSHEFDASNRKKEKKKGLTPFGDYVKSKSN